MAHNQKNSRESGIAYVAILFILVILSSLGLAFIMKVGTETVATMNRGNAMQAQYLAESAANHALWRLLNEPGFPAAGNVYYMHSLAGGRYGYKVRKPTPTTFATVATVGAMVDNVVTQGYVPYIKMKSKILTAYAPSSTSIPKSRRLVGANFSDPANTLFMGLPPITWMEVEGCPLRNEFIMGSIDVFNVINLAVWNGTSWGNFASLSLSATNLKCFDIAYENQSGDALVIGRNSGGIQSSAVYNVWNGSSWAFMGSQNAFSVPGNQINQLVMASRPGSDEILIAALTSLDELYLFQWNGSTFNSLGLIESVTAVNNTAIVDVVYESQSGHGMVIWAKKSTSSLKYRIWNGATLGPEASLPDFGGGDMYVVRAADDPTSDHIIVATIDNFRDIHVVVWNGTAWIDWRKVETDAATNIRQAVDVAWESSGDEAFVAWMPSSTDNVRALTWRKGTTLAASTVMNGPRVLDITPWLIRTLPISTSDRIILLVSKSAPVELRYCLWTGDGFKGNPAILLESSLSSSNDTAFDVAEAGIISTGGGGPPGNLPPVVNTGTDTTIKLPTNTVNLDGTVTDDGLPNPPAAFTTLWSKTSGTGTVTFGDATQIDTTAQFSTDGGYVLRLTANDSELTNFDEVTITVSADSARDLLFVVADASNPSTQELSRKTLMEGWGYQVKLISDDAPQAEFDSAVAGAEVAYIPVSIDSTILGTKLNNATIGIVNESRDMIDDFGFGEPNDMITKSRDKINIMDNSHYIVSVYPTGLLLICTSLQTMQAVGGISNPDLEVVAWIQNVGSGYAKSLVILETGTSMWGGGAAPGRRAKLPWGDASFNVSSLNNDGKNIMKRSIDWAAGLENKRLLFVVADPASLSAMSSGRKTLFESWGYIVTLVDDNDTQANFESAVAANDVAYVSPDVSDITLANKLANANKGIVNDLPDLMDDLGFCSNSTGTILANGFTQTDALHYITSPYSGSAVNTFSLSMAMNIVGTIISPSIQNVGEVSGNKSLVALNTGAFRWDSGTVPARRVHLPFGSAETGNLTADGETIMLRAIEWASGKGSGTGSGTGSGGGGGGPVSMYVNDIAMGFRKSGTTYYGRATIWIKDTVGANVAGATVSGSWTGSVTGSGSGVTSNDGKIMLESPGKKNGGTFTFTVTNVTLTGYTYNPALNVMTSNTITVP